MVAPLDDGNRADAAFYGHIAQGQPDRRLLGKPTSGQGQPDRRSEDHREGLYVLRGFQASIILSALISRSSGTFQPFLRACTRNERGSRAWYLAT